MDRCKTISLKVRLVRFVYKDLWSLLNTKKNPTIRNWQRCTKMKRFGIEWVMLDISIQKDDCGFVVERSIVVVCADGETLFPVPCEAIFNLHDAVERSALVGVNGEPVIIIERVSSHLR